MNEKLAFQGMADLKTCKNCHAALPGEESEYCDACGAQVIKERITAKKLVRDFIDNSFGWDSRYFHTLKQLTLDPATVLTDYIAGVRKRYVNPFAFLTLNVAVAMLVFNFFAKEFSKNLEDQSKIVTSITTKSTWEPILAAIDTTTAEGKLRYQDGLERMEAYKEESLKNNIEINKFVLKYMNLVYLLFLPLYAFISSRVFRKPYNYGEHLVFNAYIIGFTTIVSTGLFILSLLLTTSTIYQLSIVCMIGFYTYAFKELYKLTIGKAALKIAKFIGVLLLYALAIFLAALLVGIGIGMLFR